MIEFRLTERKIREYIITFFESYSELNYPFHNLKHTQNVVLRVNEISTFYQINERDLFIITTAAWFHDLGYLTGGMYYHEERSIAIMQGYLKNMPSDITDSIGKCILATKILKEPKELLEKIIRDADTYHLGTLDFRQTNALVEQEMEIYLKHNESNWQEKSLMFLKNHSYYTDYCQKKLNAGKEENIKWLESLVH